MDRDKRAAKAETAKSDPTRPFINMFAVVDRDAEPEGADLLSGIPAVTTHELLGIYPIYADVVPVVLNNCGMLAIILIGYRLLRQLEALDKPIPLLDMLSISTSSC